MQEKSCEGEICLEYSGADPLRLDQAVIFCASVVDAVREISRSQIKRMIEEGLVLLNGVPAIKASILVHPGDRISLRRKAVADVLWPGLEPNPIPLEIVYSDQNLLVINKPAGLSVHPGAGNRSSTLVNALLALPGLSPTFKEQAGQGNFRPGIVHRIDKDTTGLLVVALDGETHHKLSAQFAAHSIERGYFALAYSTPRGRRVVDRNDAGIIDAAIGRDPGVRTRMAILAKGGRRAVTHWRVVERMAHACFLELRLETGRTHQIRVHMAHVGSPLIGDSLYGANLDLPVEIKRLAASFNRQALHAFKLGFLHPVSGKKLLFEAPLPEDMKQLLHGFGARSEGI